VVSDWVWGLSRLHNDFSWPWPGGAAPAKVLGDLGNVEDKLRQLYVDTTDTTDSGVDVSSQGRVVSELSLLSEHTVDAMLRVRDRPVDTLSVLSEDGDMASICGPLSPPSLPSPPSLASGSTWTEKVEPSPKAEVQLRYLLQLFLEAGCLDWASILAVILRDAMAVIRIVNAGRSATDANAVVRRLHAGFIQLETFAASSPSTGYRTFLTSIQPQARSLAKFLSPPSTPTDLGSPTTEPSLPAPPAPRTSSPINKTRNRSQSESEQQRTVSNGSRPGSRNSRPRTPSPVREVDHQGAAVDQNDAGCVLS